MYLKRIELQGFKSFPEKIRLEFDRGITAVVGPNGSGKSNIADAVRWVLGEQSAKTLRGGKMEDVIFAGTVNRRQLGFAEVILVIDNEDKRLSMDFSEISVTRRMYRSGESEYRINGSVCRLRDIHEMFMDTGVGKEGYSIIGQGRIEEILSTRSEDRRLLFEEAAGIVKYKNRKHETEQRLARERTNLERVGDIISELEMQLEPLHAQSEIAKAYLALKERLKLLQVNIFLVNADKAAEELGKLEESLSALAEQIAGETGRQAEYAEGVEALKRQLDTLEAEIKMYGERDSEARVMAESFEGEIKLSTEQINNIVQDIDRLHAEAGEEKAKVTVLNEDLSKERTRLGDIEFRLIQAEEVLDGRQKAFEDVNRRMNEGEQRIEEFNARIIEKMKTASDVRTEAQRAQAAYERLEEIKESLNDDLELNGIKREENVVRLSGLEAKLTAVDDIIKKAETGMRELAIEKDANNEQLAAAADKLQAVQKQLNECTSRHKLLTELESGYEGYAKSVKTVLMQKRRFSGICGSVAELLEVDAKYETCIEVALGGTAQNIITMAEEDAVAAIEYLKQNREGRATFLPLTAVEPKNMGAQRVHILSETGVCGVAKELIRYDAVYENIFSNLLGRVIVADNIHNAIRLAKKYRHAYKIVTLEGELLSAGGAMTGGSQHRAVSLFSRSREIKELKQRIETLTKRAGVLAAEVDTLKGRLSIIKKQIEEKRAVLQQSALERATLAANLEQTHELLRTIERQEEELAAKDGELLERLRAMNRDVRGREQEIAEHEREIAKLHEQLNDFQSTMVTEKEQKEEGIRELLDAKSGISALEQNIHAARENIKRMEQSVANTQEVIDKHYAAIESRLEQKRMNEDKLLETRRKLGELKQCQIELGLELERLSEEKTQKSRELSRLELGEREAMTLLADLNAENVRLEMRKEQTVENNRRLYDEMWEEYGITYQAAAKYERIELPTSQIVHDEHDVKAEIQGLGDVNVGSIEEYRSVKERYEFLTAQREDIITAEGKLMDIIAELTELMERQFTEQFRLISENFSFVFREMFGGGKAYLKLSDENNVLEAGIDIVARPPGKTLQSMSLLSGGERALTATALLFGILRMKPSPFCILDEVEAALDDSNVIRYANYLKNFSNETQFILITHRKGTMEASDVLYGVTMQEQGVSKLVSVKFTE